MAGAAVQIEFEKAYMNSEVWLNGERPYTPSHVDVMAESLAAVHDQRD